ncbi:MAG: hypothetical protein U9R19_15280 [Bacteroidota bacterium]|nr:hypothetical protein [Bacteroidota bacterium]
MKTISIILIFLSFFCWKPPIEIIEANSQKWYSGVADGGINTRYSLTLIVNKSSDKLKIKGLYIDNEILDVQVYRKQEKSSFTSDFGKGDTIIVKASRTEIPNHSNRKKTEKSKFPANNIYSDEFIEKALQKCNGEGILFFSIKGKEKVLCIDKFKKLKNKYMP